MKANYHTHTYRCQHAEGEDAAYAEAALRGGFDTLGFADHAPWPFASGFVSSIRMGMELLPDYLESIAALRAAYAGRLDILTGLEAEWFPRYRDYLLGLRDRGVSYLILGQHYNGSEEDNPYIGFECVTDDGVRRYADQVAEAAATGLYAYIAHPDLYMRHRQELGHNRACEEAAETICQAAKEYGLPLEYNLLGLHLQLQGKNRGYPEPLFWQIAQKHGNAVILGVDAHNPASLADTALWQEGLRRVQALGLPLVKRLDINT